MLPGKHTNNFDLDLEVPSSRFNNPISLASLECSWRKKRMLSQGGETAAELSMT